MIKTYLGEKISNLRKAKGLTQSALAGDKITRNMLSCIENGTASPSLESLCHIADGLNVSVADLISEENDLFFFEKKEKIEKIYRAYEAKNYTACINIINSLTSKDSELCYILAYSYLELGKQNVANGALISAQKNLSAASRCCAETKLDTKHLQSQIPMYLAIAKNVQSPLLEFDHKSYKSAINDSVDYEFYCYLTMDYNHSFENHAYRLHMEAKGLIKERNYAEAVKKLLSAADLAKNESYNAFVIFSIYTDLEYAYKQLYNYENAYLYSTKRMTLIEEFKS